jgi:hypothetical protein
VSASGERIARNEALFREFNERVEGLADTVGADRIRFVCECGDLDCLDRVELARAAYEEVRSDARRFFVAPGHEKPEIERVVAGGEGYLVVEKLEAAAQVAIEHDPRSI